MAKSYYSGQGSLYMAERDATTGKPKGFVAVGNIPELTLDIEISKFEHKESESGDRLLDLTLITEKKGKFNFKLESMSLANLTIGLFGESATVALGNVVDEAVTARLGKRVALAHPDVSSVVVKDAATGLVTYVLNDDYTVDAKNGVLIFPTTPADIVADQALEVSYSHAAYDNLEAFTTAVAPERYMRFEGLNTVDGTRVIIDLPRAQFDPLTGYGLINEELGSITMAGSLLADEFITSGSKFMRQRNIAA